MRASSVRSSLLTAPLALLLPLAIAGCYTVLSHPKSDLSDSDANLTPDAQHGLSSSSEDCLRCHLGRGAQDLDAIGQAWNRLDRRGGLDPRWPSAYANWLGYLPDSWLDYYRDPVWRDPWLYDPWIYEGEVIIVRDEEWDTGPPPETGSRHLWGRPGLYSGSRPIHATVPTTGNVPRNPRAAPGRDHEPGQRIEADPPPSSGPDEPAEPAEPDEPAPPSGPEKGGRHLWGRPRR
jgi:hypothetical protein